MCYQHYSTRVPTFAIMSNSDRFLKINNGLIILIKIQYHAVGDAWWQPLMSYAKS